jgi:hypothetical protein
MDVEVLRPLFGDGRLEGVGAAAPGRSRGTSKAGFAAAIPEAAGWNDNASAHRHRIASRRSIVWHEEGVAGEHGVFQHVAGVCPGV